MDTTQPIDFITELQKSGFILVAFFVVTWGLRFIDGVMLNGRLNQRYCIRPREYFSLFRLFFHTFLHVDRRHLFVNTFPLILFGGLTMVSNLHIFWFVTLLIIFMSGFGIWLFGTLGSGHLGASGLILGYFGFILSRGFFTSNYPLIILALVVAWIYRGLFRIILINQPGVSSTGHFFGFVTGLLAAWLLGSP